MRPLMFGYNFFSRKLGLLFFRPTNCPKLPSTNLGTRGRLNSLIVVFFLVSTGLVLPCIYSYPNVGVAAASPITIRSAPPTVSTARLNTANLLSKSPTVTPTTSLATKAQPGQVSKNGGSKTRPAATSPTTIFGQQAILTGSDSDGVSNGSFGTGTRLSGDGTTALIGAFDLQADTATAYIFVRTNAGWSQQAKLVTGDRQVGGQSISVGGLSSDGNTAVFGSFDPFRIGAAYVFVRSGGTWTLQQKLFAADYSIGDLFGSTSLSADGNTIIVGAAGKNSSTGAAYVFKRSGSSWTQTQELMPGDITSGDKFGNDVGLSADGSTAIISAPGQNNASGAAYVFGRDPNTDTWTQTQKLTASDSMSGDSFGISQLSSDGSVAVIGAYSKNLDSGEAYIFTRNGASWSQQAEIAASDGASNEEFGFDVGISGDGNTVVIGAGGNNSTFGGQTGNKNPYFRGAAYIFARSSGTGNSWKQQQKLTASDAQTGDYFGAAVAISSDATTVLIGARSRHSNAGAAYVFGATATPTYSYYVPFAANNGPGLKGNYTTYLNLQNIGTQPANFTITYYNTGGTVIGTDNNNSTLLAPNATHNSLIGNQAGLAGTAAIASDQPLAVLVALSGNFNGNTLVSGFTAVTGNNDAGFTIAAPLAFNHAFGNFSTAFVIQNVEDTTAQVTVTYYDNNGNSISSQSATIAGHNALTLDQTDPAAGLPMGFNGWAVISSAGGQHLAGLVIELNPDTNFLSAVSCVGTIGKQLFIPVIYQNAFGNFNTGLNLANPNSVTATVSISYYQSNGTRVATSLDNLQLPGNSVISFYHGSSSAFPEFGGSFVGSAVISSNQSILVGVNQGGTVGGNPLTGTFGTLSSGSNQVSLPTIVKKAYGANFSSGLQLLNSSNVATTFTVTFYNGNTGQFQYSTQVTGPNGAALAPYSTATLYEGSDGNLPDGFIGTALITANAPGASVVAVVNVSNGQYFYTYAEAQ